MSDKCYVKAVEIRQAVSFANEAGRAGIVLHLPVRAPVTGRQGALKVGWMAIEGCRPHNAGAPPTKTRSRQRAQQRAGRHVHHGDARSCGGNAYF